MVNSISPMAVEQASQDGTFYRFVLEMVLLCATKSLRQAAAEQLLLIATQQQLLVIATQQQQMQQQQQRSSMLHYLLSLLFADLQVRLAVFPFSISYSL